MMRQSILFIVLLFTFSCARISSPPGGPEDKEPPVLISSIPTDGQTNYSESTITLTFDESVTTKAIETNLIITPSITGSFKTKVKRNKIELSFDSTWRENTTYSLNFGNTIADLNEGNQPSNLYLSFSTGPTIDSLSVSGTITNLYSTEPVENALVSLYTTQDTIDITSGKALYYTKTDSAGNYKFQNLPNGNFLVYGVVDKNNNLKADTDKELYGFLPDTVNLTSNQADQSFVLQRLNTNELSIKTGRNYGKYYDLTFSKPIQTYAIDQPSGRVANQRRGVDQIRFYNIDVSIGDTLIVPLTATDSIGQTISENVKVFFKESNIEPEDFSTAVTLNQQGGQDQLAISATFNKPVKREDLNKIKFVKDSTEIYTLPANSTNWNQDRTVADWVIPISTLINQNEKLTITYEPGAFISVENDSSKMVNKQYQRLKTEDSGIIKGKISTDAENYIVQLLNNQNQVLHELVNQPEYTFDGLSAGNYKVRLIIDKNNNGKLDVGNITNRTPAETVIFYTDPLNQARTIGVKKNWEVDGINISHTVNNPE